MAELTFYPDADPELTSVDGFAYRSLTPGETWANILAGAGIYAIDDSSPLYCPYMRSYTSTDKWRTNGRAPLLFDTSLLLPSYSLKSAQLKIYVGELRDDAGWKPDLVCVSSNPASNTAVIPADYQAFGSIPLSSVLAYDSIVLKTYNVLQLNAAGLAAIVKGGITKLGLRNSNYDISGSAPLWASDKRSWFAILTADYVEGSPPALVVTYQQIVVPTVTTNPVRHRHRFMPYDRLTRPPLKAHWLMMAARLAIATLSGVRQTPMNTVPHLPRARQQGKIFLKL